MGDSNSLETSLPESLRKLPHYLYVADLVAGKQVLEVGCGAGDGARFLAEHGAARVVALDSRADRIERARRKHEVSNLAFRHEDPAALELPDDSFDCVFVPEGAALLKRSAVLRELRRVLAPSGHLIVVAPSADRRSAQAASSDEGVGFHQVRDALEPLFQPVRMVAQTPLVAMSLVEYGEDDAPEVALDTSLLAWSRAPEDEVVDYMAICGGEASSSRGFTIVQLPLRPGVDVARTSIDGEVASNGALSGGDGTVSTQIAGALQAHAELVRDLEAALVEQQAYCDEMREELEHAEERAETLSGERAGNDDKLAAAQAEAKAWRSRVAQAEGEVLRVRLMHGEDPSIIIGEMAKAEAEAKARGEEPPLADETDMDVIRGALAELRRRADSSAKSEREALSERDALQRRVEKLEYELKGERETSTKSAADAQRQFQSDMAKAMKDASAKLSASQKQLAQCEERCDSMVASLDALREERESLKARVDAAESEKQRARDAAPSAVEIEVEAETDADAPAKGGKKAAAKKSATKKAPAKKAATKKAATKSVTKKAPAKKAATKKAATKKSVTKKAPAKKAATKKSVTKKAPAKKAATKKSATKKASAKKTGKTRG